MTDAERRVRSYTTLQSTDDFPDALKQAFLVVLAQLYADREGVKYEGMKMQFPFHLLGGYRAYPSFGA